MLDNISNFINKRNLVIIIIILFVSSFTISCDNNTAENNEVKNESVENSENTEFGESIKDTLIVGVASDAGTLDPQYSASYNDFRITENIYDTLVDSDEHGEIIPRLAVDWEIYNDGMEYIFYLREDVVFHNGEKLTSEDVKYTLERGMNSPYVQAFLSSIDKIEIIDEYTINIVLKTYEPNFLQVLSIQAFGIVNEKSIAEAGDNYASQPIGTGPYKLLSWSNGENMILERFDRYWGGKVYLKTIKIRVLSDDGSRTIALENGEIDLSLGVQVNDKNIVRENSKLLLFERPTTTVVILGMNNNQPPFDNKTLRQAIAYAIEKESVLLGGGDGEGTIAQSILPDYMDGFADMSYSRDIEKAKKLLVEAGYPDGLEINLTVMSSYKKVATVIQAQLEQIGIDVKIEVMEPNAFLQNIPNNKFFVISMTGPLPNADSILFSMFFSETIGMAGNLTYTNESKLDELLLEAKVERNSESRVPIYVEVQNLLKDYASALPMYFLIEETACDKALKGVKAFPNGILIFKDISW